MLQRLAELRKNKKWSLQETADRLGIAKSTYAGYESGYREPSLQSLIQMADLFETTVDYILNRTDDTYPNINLSELVNQDHQVLSLDEFRVTHEEVIDMIAFIRAKRHVKRELDKGNTSLGV